MGIPVTDCDFNLKGSLNPSPFELTSGIVIRFVKETQALLVFLIGCGQFQDPTKFDHLSSISIGRLFLPYRLPITLWHISHSWTGEAVAVESSIQSQLGTKGTVCYWLRPLIAR